MLGQTRNAVVGTVLVTWLAAACAQGPSIYTCVDAKGRRLTSDRPIPECVDREQKELNKSGTVRRTVGPTLTQQELAAKEELERKANEEKLRQAEEKRRQRAMLARYPNQVPHDAERAKALNAVQEVILAGQKRATELQQQRKALMVEAEPFRGDVSKYPARLKRSLDENEQLLAGQQRFLANQEEEKGRVNKRFDEELAVLRTLWAQQRGIAVAPTAAAPAAASSPPVRR
jgi:hypothetical protein